MGKEFWTFSPRKGPWVPSRPVSLTMLLIRITGIIGHQLCVAWSFMVLFGHKDDSILP